MLYYRYNNFSGLAGTNKPTQSNKKYLEKVKNLVKVNGVCLNTTSPHESLQKGNWVKLICGASFEVFYNFTPPHTFT